MVPTNMRVLRKKTTLGQDAVVVGTYENLYYGFILAINGKPHIIHHMRWNASGRAIDVMGNLYRDDDFDLKGSAKI